MQQKLIKRLVLFLLILISIVTIVYAYAANTFLFSSSGTVTLTKGKVSIIRSGKTTNKQLATGTEIYPGDTIITNSNGYAVVRLKNNYEFTIQPGQRFILLSIFDTNKVLSSDLQVFSTLRRTMNFESETSNTITTSPG